MKLLESRNRAVLAYGHAYFINEQMRVTVAPNQARLRSGWRAGSVTLRRLHPPKGS